ncbi:MAG: hypothetical protein ABIO37_16260 [Caulobacteraceae bacterium]
MIPWFAVVRIKPEHGRSFRLWLPLFLIWILLAPFALLLVPMMMVYAAICRVNPFAAIAAIGRLFWALGGVQVEVDSPHTSVLIRTH